MASKRIKKKRRKRDGQCALCGALIDFNKADYVVGITGKTVCGKCFTAGKHTIPPPLSKLESECEGVITPSALIQRLNSKIIGQDQAKRAVAVALWKQQLRAKGLDLPNSGLLLYGPTGCGKTALVREAANIAGLPFLCFDATTLTETGYRGKEASDILRELVSRFGPEKARCGVVFLDEVDKLAATKENSYRASYSRGTQHSLLKLLDGGEFTIEDASLSSKDILFLFGGAFSGLRDEKAGMLHRTPIGFCSEEVSSAKDANLTMEDLIGWGMEPELMGRIGRIVPLHPLDKTHLRSILLHSDLSVYRRYQLSFARQGYTVDFSEPEIDGLIEQASALGLGARGLNALVEERMEDKLMQWSEGVNA